MHTHGHIHKGMFRKVKVAKWVSEELGIDEYFARILPHQKVDIVRDLQKRAYMGRSLE